MPEISTLAENYLKVIWSANEWTDQPVTPGALASKLGLAPSSVSEGIRKLADAGLVSHEKYGAVTLTPAGLAEALRIVRKHRLIETFLVDYLGYNWDEVHDEAEVLEHAVSDTFIERLAEQLGQPTRDPHGDPIPAADGSLPGISLIVLPDIAPGSRVTVGQVSDADSEVLRLLDSLGIGLDAELQVLSGDAHAVRVAFAGATVELPTAAASAIRVLP